MKNSEDHIDKLFSDKLKNQSFDIPAKFISDLTNRLDAAMPTQRKRRGGIFFFLLNGLFLLIFLSLAFTNQFIIQRSRVRNELANSGVMEVTSSQQGQIESDSGITSDESLASVKNTFNLEEMSSAGKENNTVESTNPAFNEQQGKMEVSRGETTNRTARDQGQGSGMFDIKLLEDSVGSTSAISQERGNDKGIERNSDSNFPPDTIFIRDTVIIYDTLLIRDTLVVRDTIIQKDTIQAQVKDSSKWKAEFQFFAGVNYGAEGLMKTTTSSATYLLEERALLTPSFGFNVNAIRNKVSIGSGIEFFQTGEKFELNSSSFTQVDTIEIVGFDIDTVIFNQQTQTNDTIFIPIYDSVSYVDTVSSVANWTNTYAWVSIPLNFGYRFDVGNWALIPRVGVSFNLGVSNSTGDYPSVSGTNLVVTSAPPVAFNMDYLLQLEILRTLNKAELFISPIYRGNITPMVANSPTRRFQSFGLRFGLAVQL